MSKPAVYLRVSTHHQSTDSQVADLRSSCERRGIAWDDCAIYEDASTSGSTWTREGLDRMMADCAAGKVSMVICYKLDRLGRSLAHLARLWMQLEDLGIPLWVPSQGIDTSAANPAAKLQMHVMAAFAEFERSVIRERVKAGMESARAKGVHLGRPKGYRPRKSKRRLGAERLIRETDLGDTAIGKIVGATRVAVWKWRKELQEEESPTPENS